MAGPCREFRGGAGGGKRPQEDPLNEWLEAAEKQERLGWDAQVTRDEAGHLLVETSGVPSGAKVRAEIRRPLGDHDTNMIELFEGDEGLFRSAEALPAGRWTVRLLIESSQHRYAIEEPLV